MDYQQLHFLKAIVSLCLSLFLALRRWYLILSHKYKELYLHKATDICFFYEKKQIIDKNIEKDWIPSIDPCGILWIISNHWLKDEPTFNLFLIWER